MTLNVCHGLDSNITLSYPGELFLTNGTLPNITVLVPPPGAILYTDFPAVLPINVPSLGIEATSTTQFGNYIELNTTESEVYLSSVAFILSSQTAHSDFPGYNATTNATLNELGYLWNITALFFNVDMTNASYPTIKNLLFKQTSEFFIPWRPENNASCPNPEYLGPDDLCHSGVAFVAELIFTAGAALVTNVLVVGVSWNTQHYGFLPTNMPGPSASLNVGVVSSFPTVGTYLIENTAFVNSSDPNTYNDDGGQLGVYRINYGWSPYLSAVRITQGTGPTTTGTSTSGVTHIVSTTTEIAVTVPIIAAIILLMIVTLMVSTTQTTTLGTRALFRR